VSRYFEIETKNPEFGLRAPSPSCACSKRSSRRCIAVTVGIPVGVNVNDDVADKIEFCACALGMLGKVQPTYFGTVQRRVLAFIVDDP
jgi:hypothetical protein